MCVRVCVCSDLDCVYLRVSDVYLLFLDASGLLRAVTQFSHLAADTIVNGAATSHSAPTDQADRKRRTFTPQLIVSK